MRIGTWNLAGRWTPAHREFLSEMDCDVLLLTEVSDRLELAEYDARLTNRLMAPKRRWAGVFSRHELTALPDPHPASAMARVHGLTFCSSILPWRSCGSGEPWHAGPHAAKTQRTIDELVESLPTTGQVWGGDWNHALRGREWSGSQGGRACIVAAVAQLNLQVPTTDLPHRIDGLLTIDHIAVPTSVRAEGVSRVSAHDGAARYVRAMPNWDAVTRNHVLAAIAEYDELGRDEFLDRYGFGPARSYVLQLDGRSYDSKAILGAAHLTQPGVPPEPTSSPAGSPVPRLS